MYIYIYIQTYLHTYFYTVADVLFRGIVLVRRGQCFWVTVGRSPATLLMLTNHRWHCCYAMQILGHFLY